MSISRKNEIHKIAEQKLFYEIGQIIVYVLQPIQIKNSYSSRWNASKMQQYLGVIDDASPLKDFINLVKPWSIW